MRVTGEIRERYGRDENNPSRAQTPLYKGYPSDDGRDEGILSLHAHPVPLRQ